LELARQEYVTRPEGHEAGNRDLYLSLPIVEERVEDCPRVLVGSVFFLYEIHQVKATSKRIRISPKCILESLRSVLAHRTRKHGIVQKVQRIKLR
jgi:hypothetical protein